MVAPAIRLAGFLAALIVVGAVEPAARAGAAPRVLLFADRDDDDADGVPDGEQAVVPRTPELLAVPHPAAIPADATFSVHGDAVRLLADGVALAPGAPIPTGAARLELQATRPGRAEVDVFGRKI